MTKFKEAKWWEEGKNGNITFEVFNIRQILKTRLFYCK